MLAGPTRARIPYGHDPTMLLYFLDQNAFPPEAARHVGVRRPPHRHYGAYRSIGSITLRSAPSRRFATVLTVSMGAGAVSVTLTPGTVAAFDVPARGIRALESYAYLLSASSSEGFVPALLDPKASPPDYRNLGALVRFSAVTVPAHRPDDDDTQRAVLADAKRSSPKRVRCREAGASSCWHCSAPSRQPC